MPTKAELLAQKTEIEKQLKDLEAYELNQVYAKDFFTNLGLKATDDLHENAENFMEVIRLKNKQFFNAYDLDIRILSPERLELIYNDQGIDRDFKTYLALHLSEGTVDLMLENHYSPKDQWSMEAETPYGTLTVSYDLYIDPENNSFHGKNPALVSSYLIEDVLPLKTPEDLDKLCGLLLYAEKELKKEDQEQLKNLLEA